MKVVGRGRELAMMRSWPAAETGRLVLCGGEPGIGKTRLAQELAGHALAIGREVVRGHCVETEGAPAFWPWRQILKAAGAWPDEVLAHDAEVPQDRFRVFDAIATALDRDGLVIIVEDVHCADQASLLVLAHLATTCGTQLMFATFRDPCPAAADLMRSAVRIDLHGLSADAVAELVGAEHAPTIAELTSGNPLFVTEIARAVDDGTWRPDQPPRSVRDIVTARLDRLGPDARTLIRTAARYACRAGDEFRVIAVWESEEHADRFFREVLGPILARVLGPEPAGAPAVTGMEVLREFIPAAAG